MMERLKLPFLFALMLELSIFFVGTEPAGSYTRLREYGEQCNLWSAPCNSAAYLTCYNGCCGCQAGMTYDSTVRSCICPTSSSIVNQKCAPPSQRCSHNTHCMSGMSCVNGKCACDTTTSLYDAKYGKCLQLVGSICSGRASGLECVEGAFCNGAAGTCQCLPGYFLTYGGLCAKRIERTSPCITDGQCSIDKDSGQALKCVNGICDCDPKTSVFSTLKTKFVNYVYNSGGILVQNPEQTVSLCAPKAGLPCVGGLEGYCAPGKVCKSGTCRCESGRVDPNGRGECLVDIGGSCNATNACVTALSCVDGACSCRFQGQEYVNGVCRSPFNCPCAKDEECDEQSRCVVSSGARQGHCGPCSPGWSLNKRGFCQILLSHGGYCEGANQCDDVAELRCVDNKCQCPGHAVYSPEERKCLILSGCHCGVKPGDKCVPNAVCVQNHPYLPGHCACEAGFTESSHYTCEAPGPGNEITKRPVIVIPITTTQATTTTTTLAMTPETKPTTTTTTTTTTPNPPTTTTTTTTTEEIYVYDDFEDDSTTAPSPPTTTTTTTTTEVAYIYDDFEEDSTTVPSPLATTTITEDSDYDDESEEFESIPTTEATVPVTQVVEFDSEAFDSFENAYFS